MKQKLLLLVLLITFGFAVMAQQNTGTSSSLSVQSPDGKIKATVDLKDKILYAVTHDGDVVVAPPLSPCSSAAARR